jgi:perosamine synthetase
VNRISVSSPQLIGNESQYVADCLERNWLSYGPYVKQFEAEFARYLGLPYALATSSGTTALHLLLAGLNVQRGDEVIVPNITFVATANAVRYCGAKPVFVDVNPYDWTIDPDEVERLINARTVGIIAVSLFGAAPGMDALNALATKHRIWVVEDAAQGLGGASYGRKIGTLATAACFSFYANKTITTGEGGMVVTEREELRDRMYLLRGQAQKEPGRYFHIDIGFNYRMTDLQGAIGCAQLEQLAALLRRRRTVFQQYRQLLDRRPGVTLQHIHEHSIHACWMVAVLLRVPNAVVRDRVMRGLAEDGIETRPMFVPLNRLPMYADGRTLGVSNRIGDSGICLPTHGALLPEDVERVCARLLSRIAQEDV